MENKNILKQHEIRALLRKRHGYKFRAMLAEKAGKSGAWVSRHIAGTLRTREGRKLIARHVGVKLSQIYPE